MRILLSCLLCLSVAGCGGIDLPFAKKRPNSQFADATPPEGTIRPRARPGSLNGDTPPENARTAEDFDTTSQAEREAAQDVSEGGEKLGTTIATLGSPTEPGFWLKTPLVSTPRKGRVVYPTSAKSVQVDLIPIDGPATAGSRMSLAALRLIGAPLTGLPEVEVYSE